MNEDQRQKVKARMTTNLSDRKEREAALAQRVEEAKALHTSILKNALTNTLLAYKDQELTDTTIEIIVKDFDYPYKV